MDKLMKLGLEGLRMFLRTAEEGVVNTIFDGFAARIFETLIHMLDYFFIIFFEGFGPSIKTFVMLLDGKESAGDAESLGNIVEGGWFAFSFEGSDSNAAKFMGIFALTGTVLCILIFLFTMIKCTLLPMVESRDTPLKTLLKFLFAMTLINFSAQIMDQAFSLMRWIWDATVALKFTAGGASSNVVRMASAIVEAVEGDENLLDVSDTTAGETAAQLFGFATEEADHLVGILVMGIALIMIIWELVKFTIEIVERYMVASFLYMGSPIVFATIVSNDTITVFKSYCRMVFSQLFLLVMNLLCVRMFLYMCGGMQIKITSLFICIGFLKAAQRLDSYMASMGLNVATTGGNILDSIYVAAKSMSGIGKKLLGAAGGMGAAVDKDRASNGVVVRAGDSLSQVKNNNPYASQDQIGKAVMEKNKGAMTGEDAQTTNWTEDGSIANQMAAGDLATYNGLAAKPQEALTGQYFDPRNKDDWKNNSFTKAIGADNVQNVRFNRAGTGLEPGATAKFGNKQIPIVGSVNKGDIKNPIGAVPMRDGRTMYIGNAGIKGKDQGLKAVGSESINRNMKQVQAITGLSEADMSKLTGIEAGRITGAKYNEQNGTLELFNGAGNQGEAVGAILEQKDGSQFGVQYMDQEAVAAMDDSRLRDNFQENIDSDGMYIGDASLADGSTHVFNTAEERFDAEYAASSSEVAGTVVSRGSNDVSVSGGISESAPVVNGHYQEFGNAVAASAMKQDMNDGVYGSLWNGAKVAEVHDISNLHNPNREGSRYNNGLYEVTLETGERKYAQIVNSARDIPVKDSKREFTFVQSKGKEKVTLKLFDKTPETANKLRNSSDKTKQPNQPNNNKK